MLLGIKQKPDFKFLIYFQWVSFAEDAESSWYFDF